MALAPLLKPIATATAIHELLEGRVRLHEVIRRQLNAEPGAQVRDTLRLVLAPAVGQEDERDGVLL